MDILAAIGLAIGSILNPFDPPQWVVADGFRLIGERQIPILFRPLAFVNETCSRRSGRIMNDAQNYIGCATLNYILIRNDLTGEDLLFAIEHEVAHIPKLVRGYGWDHPRQ